MNASERRTKIIELLRKDGVISGSQLSKILQVSRQIVVQDIALLRAQGNEIYSTSRGYQLEQTVSCSRVFKTIHTDEQAQEEMSLIIDHGGRIEDVFVYHKIYGVVRSRMDIKSRLDIKNYIANIHDSRSGFLKNITSGYHYHTVYADSVEILDLIQEALEENGFLAPLQDYEPVKFGNDLSVEPDDDFEAGTLQKSVRD